MLEFKRTDSADKDFLFLVRQLDQELKVIDGDEHAFFAQFNGLEEIRHVILLYKGEQVIACGAFKSYKEKTVEIKRMYVLPEFRSKGMASLVLNQLEIWAKESGIESCILETGMEMEDAIRLYTKNGYKRIANFGQYKGVIRSRCFRKSLL